MVDMSFDDTVRNRRSVRGFLPEQIPQDLMKRVFEIAQLSPSGTNVQPWQAYVASGEVRDKLRAEFITRVQAKIAANPDRPDKGRLGDPWKERRRGCARVLFDSMGIEWEDKAGRAAASFRNFEMFDAPHVVFIGMNEIFGAQTAADVGMYAQTLMLAMTANGLASCAQGTMAHYPDLVRETFNIPDDVKILFGISFGFEDVTIPANKAMTIRASLEESVQFLG